MTARCVLKTTLFVCAGVAAAWLSPVTAHAEEAALEEKKTYQVESGFYYTIQKGDTLWGLSERFFDSPWVWPDLWEKNKYIANPHWIEPDTRIRIFGREGVEKVSIGQSEEEVEVIWTEASLMVDGKPQPYFFYPPIDGVGFIRKSPVTPVGTVFRSQERKALMSIEDVIYVRPEQGRENHFEKGKFLTVFRTLERVEYPETEEDIGVPHHMLGVIKITQVEAGYSIAKVVKGFSHGAIEVNDLLMPYERRPRQIRFLPAKEGLDGRVIMSEKDNRKLMDPFTILFIDKGSNDGVEMGQSYSTYYQDKEYLDPESDEAVLLSPVNFARILILRTEEATATAIVTMADKVIEPWDKFHAPAPSE